MRNVTQSILRKSGAVVDGMVSGALVGGEGAAGVLAATGFFFFFFIVNQSPREASKNAY